MFGRNTGNKFTFWFITEIILSNISCLCFSQKDTYSIFLQAYVCKIFHKTYSKLFHLQNINQIFKTVEI